MNQFLTIEVINDGRVNRGQKLLFRTLEYQDLVLWYDDGSDVAVWTNAECDIFDYFPEAEKTEYKSVLIGFGKEYDVCVVYKIPKVVIADRDGNKTQNIN